MSGPSAPTLPIKNRSTVTPAGGRTPKKSGGNNQKQRDGSSRHKAWADFTPTPWDYVSTPWATTTAAVSGVSGIPPYDSVFGAVAAGAAAGGAGAFKSKKDGGAWPSTPTPKSWGATPTPSGLPPPTNFGICVPPPIMGQGSLPIFPPGFAAMAQMAAASAAGVAAGAAAAAAAAALSPDGSPLFLFQEDAQNEDFEIRGKAAEATHGVDGIFESPPWTLQPGTPFPTGPLSQGGGVAQEIEDFKGEAPSATYPSSGLPSKGSVAHGTGKCRPCAWFWKPDGCHSAQDCNYCHLCPEGELKSRKKLKVAAMRMGALTPAKPGQPPGAARTLKLTSLV